MKSELNDKIDYFEKEFAIKYDENNIPLASILDRDIRSMVKIVSDVQFWRQSYGAVSLTDFEDLIESYFIDKDEIFEYKLQKRIFQYLELNAAQEANRFLTDLSVRIAHKKIDFKIAGLLIRTSTNS